MSTALPIVSLVRTPRLLPVVGWTAFAGALAYLVGWPLLRLQSLATADGGEGYTRAGQLGAWDTVGTTVVLALGSVTIALVAGTGLAWAALRLPRRLAWMKVLPILPIVIPAVASVTGWAFLLSPQPGYINVQLRRLPWWDHLIEGPVNVYTTPWIVLLTGFSLTSFVYLFVSSGLQNIGSDLIEAAETSGSGPRAVFFKIVLPLLRPVLFYGGTVVLLLGLGQFTAPLLLGRTGGVDVLTTEMFQAVNQTPSQVSAAAAMSSPLVVLGLLLVVAQKFVIGNQARYVTHGGKGGFRPPSRSSWLAAGSVSGYFLLSTLLPLIALTIVALSPFWTSEIRTDLFSLDNFRTVLETPRIRESVTNSVTVSVLSVLIVLPIGFAAAHLLVRGTQHRLLRPLVDFVVAVPLTLPAVIFGIGFSLAYTQGPINLYGSKAAIVVVYVTLMIPFATRMQLAGMLAIGTAYVEASRTSGARAMRTNLRIVLPLLRSSLAGSAALMFVLLTHEFSASLLVRSPDTQVMGTALFDLWGNGTYPLVAALALVMSAVTMVGVGVAFLFGGRDVLSKL